MHPLIIYLLYKIGNNLKYDYIYTMFVIGIYYSIIMLCNFINVEYKIIKNYPGALAGFICYIGYLIIPLIYINKHYEEIVKKIEIIDKNLEDDHVNIENFEELFKKIHEIILIDLYEKTIEE